MAVVVLCVGNIKTPKRCLILKRGSTAPWDPSQWSLPGGLIDGREDPATDGIRELKEEADLEATNGGGASGRLCCPSDGLNASG